MEAKHDIKGDVIGGAIGIGGGTVVGAIAQPRGARFRFRTDRKRRIHC